jgi:nucleoid-associated protein YgaU
VVVSGDTLSKIAPANRDVLSDPNKISPGQKLRIP